MRDFTDGFLHTFVILFIANLFDRFVIDELWVGHTNARTIPGTEDLTPYITNKDKAAKWVFGISGSAAMSAANSSVFIREQTLADGGEYCDCHYLHTQKIRRINMELGDVQETMQSKPRITDKKAVRIIETLGINTNQYKKFFTYEEKQS